MTPRMLALSLLPEDATLLYLTEFGSVLYGTNTPSSDTDLKGIYLPSIKSALLYQAPETIVHNTSGKDVRNTSDDVDITLYSVTYYIDLLFKGEVGAIDILFSLFRDDTQHYCSPAMQILKDNHTKLVSKQSKAFVGYCMNQAAKYGIKGSRYGELISFADYLDTLTDDTAPISTILSTIPELSYITVQLVSSKTHQIMTHAAQPTDKSYIQVLGALHADNTTIAELKRRVLVKLATYGGRTILASQGVDWKALSHAYRVIYQFNELCKTNFIKFPLDAAPYITLIKLCNDVTLLPEHLDNIASMLAATEELVESSTLPDIIEPQLRNALKWHFFQGQINGN